MQGTPRFPWFWPEDKSTPEYDVASSNPNPKPLTLALALTLALTSALTLTLGTTSRARTVC